MPHQNSHHWLKISHPLMRPLGGSYDGFKSMADKLEKGYDITVVLDKEEPWDEQLSFPNRTSPLFVKYNATNDEDIGEMMFVR